MILGHLLRLNIFFVYFKNDKFTYPTLFFCVAVAPIYMGRLKKNLNKLSEDVNLKQIALAGLKSCAEIPFRIWVL